MDRATVLLQGLRERLQLWEPFLRRATHGEVEFRPRAAGEFAVYVRWRNRDGTPGEYMQEFTKKFVFGSSFQLAPAAWAVEKRVCDYARGLVRSVLEARGIA